MIIRQFKNQILLLFFAAGSAVLLLFTLSLFSIYESVKTQCLAAKKEYQLDCLSSLMKVVASEEHSFQQRNSAIWTIGQMADPKALPFLLALEKDLPEDQACGYHVRLCRHEVEKAIKWCQQGNLTNWMYQNRESW